jgi:hypothetical protein
MRWGRELPGFPHAPSGIGCTTRMKDSSCESSLVAGRHGQIDTPRLHIRNWCAFNKALKRRGSLTIWFDPSRGRHLNYSDAAIQTCRTRKVLFEMALRQIELWERHCSE